MVRRGHAAGYCCAGDVRVLISDLNDTLALVLTIGDGQPLKPLTERRATAAADLVQAGEQQLAAQRQLTRSREELYEAGRAT